jgi:hypothetical protein
MNKTFNELFDDFFKKNKINPSDRLKDSYKDEAKKMIELLSSFNTIPPLDEEMEKELDVTLGIPDEIERYRHNGVLFERRIWHVEKGDVIKIIALQEGEKPIKSLQEKLDDAIISEEYEIAAAIRDEMNKNTTNNIK